MPNAKTISPSFTCTGIARVIKNTFLLCGLCLVVACSSINELQNTKTPKNSTNKHTGAINVASRATGIDTNVVGRTTLLSIPVGRIKVRGDMSASIMKGVEDALRAAGYNDKYANDYSTDNAPYLKAHVEDIAFGNFLASTWGTVIIHVRLETREGVLLWKKRVRTSINALTNYNRTAAIAMNHLVSDLANAFSDEDFYQASQRIRRHEEFLNET